MPTQLGTSPDDGITNLEFAKTKDYLLVSSWDQSIRLYDIHHNEQVLKLDHSAPVLDCCFISDTVAFGAGLDKQISRIDLTKGVIQSWQLHDDAVRCICHCSEMNSIVSGSWDKSLKMWDDRKSDTVAATNLPCKVFAMDCIENKIVVAMADRLVFIYDCRNLKAPLQKRESALKYMTRTLKCMPDGKGYVSTSMEGRIAVEYFQPDPEWQAKKYAFKCHRKVVDDVDEVFPVNAISFHPGYHTFASGGGDGVVNLWDGFNKKRLRQLDPFPTSISSLSFNATGDLLAIASSYTFEEGEKEHPADTIFVHEIMDTDVRPKHLK